MLLFWCSWFKYRFIKLDLITVGKFCFHFSRVLGSVVDCVNVNPAWRLNHARKLRNTYGLQAVSCSETDHRARLTQKKTKQKKQQSSTQCQYSGTSDIQTPLYQIKFIFSQPSQNSDNLYLCNAVTQYQGHMERFDGIEV